MTLTYQRFTAVLLLIYGSIFLSGIYYCLRVFWCDAARMSEIELQQRTLNFLLLNFMVTPCVKWCRTLFITNWHTQRWKRRVIKTF